MTNPSQETPGTYRDAIAELDRLLAEIEGESVQVDELAVKVERAAWLITHCQSVLRRTQHQVNHTLDALDAHRQGQDSNVSVVPDSNVSTAQDSASKAT